MTYTQRDVIAMRSNESAIMSGWVSLLRDADESGNWSELAEFCTHMGLHMGYGAMDDWARSFGAGVVLACIEYRHDKGEIKESITELVPTWWGLMSEYHFRRACLTMCGELFSTPFFDPRQAAGYKETVDMLSDSAWMDRFLQDDFMEVHIDYVHEIERVADAMISCIQKNNYEY